MKNLRVMMVFTVLAMLFVAACSNEKDKQGNESPDFSLGVIEVEAKITPEKGAIDAPIKIEALVTLGTEKVEDANEVLFEIWRKGQEGEHEKVLGKHEGKGIYAIEKSFTEAGLYFVISHVTARNMHTMPTNAFVIGEVSDEDLKEMEEVNSRSMDLDHDHDHGDEHEEDHGEDHNKEHEDKSGH